MGRDCGRKRGSYKPFIVPQNTETAEGWRDSRTGLRLAPGAVQNWPSAKDEEYLKGELERMRRG